MDLNGYRLGLSFGDGFGLPQSADLKDGSSLVFGRNGHGKQQLLLSGAVLARGGDTVIITKTDRCIDRLSFVIDRFQHTQADRNMLGLAVAQAAEGIGRTGIDDCQAGRGGDRQHTAVDVGVAEIADPDVNMKGLSGGQIVRDAAPSDLQDRFIERVGLFFGLGFGLDIFPAFPHRQIKVLIVSIVTDLKREGVAGTEITGIWKIETDAKRFARHGGQNGHRRTACAVETGDQRGRINIGCLDLVIGSQFGAGILERDAYRDPIILFDLIPADRILGDRPVGGSQQIGAIDCVHICTETDRLLNGGRCGTADQSGEQEYRGQPVCPAFDSILFHRYHFLSCCLR